MPAPPQPRLSPVGNTSRYVLVSDYVYEWEHEGRRQRLTVPEGFILDYASVPRLLWPLIGPFDLGPAAVPHDWIYRHRGRLPAGSHQTHQDGLWRDLSPDEYTWPRRDADRLFGRMMRESGVAGWKRRAAFLAVRAFGLRAWYRHTSPLPTVESPL